MAQYEKLINLSLLNQFLTKAKTIFAPKITASGILKGDGTGNVSAATAGTDYATPSQALALGLTGASVGDLVRVNAVDSNGKPTSWKHVPLNEIKCNKNLLDNWYFVGGGSQLGDGVFPINQRGQTTYSGSGYGIDRWSLQSAVQCTLNTDYITVKASQNYTNFTQRIKTDLSDKKLTLSILTTDGCFSISFIASSTDTFLPIHTSEHNVSIYLRASANNGVTNVSLFAGGGANDNPVQINIIAIKLELGPEQTLAHNEGTEQNPVWVLNEIPDYWEELRKCQRYFVRLYGSSNFIGSGFVQDSNSARATFPMPKMAKNSPTVTLNGTMYIQVAGHTGPSSLAVSTILESSFNNSSLFFLVGGLSGLTPGQGCLIQLRDNTSHIDISAEQ